MDSRPDMGTPEQIRPKHHDVPPLEDAPVGTGWPSDDDQAAQSDASSTAPSADSPADSSADSSAGSSTVDRPAEQRRKRRISAASATIALLVGLLAFALVVQVQSNSGDTQLENARQDDLVRILSDLNAREQRLRTEINTLQGTLAQLGAGAQGREAALAEARRRADELGILAGTLPAAGEGLTIRLMPRDNAVRSSTVLETVEELRGAGAEAMQIAGRSGTAVRIIASTFFADGPNGLIVDGQSLPAPYTMTVIGPATTMKTALMIPGGVADTVARDGGTLLVDEAQQVRVDALHPAESLEYARPVD
jgi:uncharacterized protein YlxW (UPF0749 family)